MGPVEGPGGPRVGYARVYCKSWECSYCGPRKAARVCRLIEAAAKKYGLHRLLTLTLDPRKCADVEDLVAYIRGVWRKFRVYLARKYGKAVEFIAVVEAHKSGIPHLHVLVDRFIKQSWISGAWDALGGGRVADIRYVADLEQIGWYLGKYLSKDMLLGHKPGVRRYSTSRGVKLNPKLEDTGWYQAPAPIEQLVEAAGEAASDIVLDGRGVVKSFTTELPIQRVKGLGGRLIMFRPPPKYVDPDEAIPSATWEEVAAILEELREEDERRAKVAGVGAAGSVGTSSESEKVDNGGAGAGAPEGREGD